MYVRRPQIETEAFCVDVTCCQKSFLSSLQVLGMRWVFCLGLNWLNERQLKVLGTIYILYGSANKAYLYYGGPDLGASSFYSKNFRKDEELYMYSYILYYYILLGVEGWKKLLVNCISSETEGLVCSLGILSSCLFSNVLFNLFFFFSLMQPVL